MYPINTATVFIKKKISWEPKIKTPYNTLKHLYQPNTDSKLKKKMYRKHYIINRVDFIDFNSDNIKHITFSDCDKIYIFSCKH